MPATLPPINMSGSVLAGQMSQEHTKAETPMNQGILLPEGPAIRFETKRDAKQRERRARLRSLQKDLTRVQTAKYRNSLKHSLCLDMLQEGFHKSFSEMFALIKQQNERRLKAGPESVLWNMVMLETETEKMEMLKKYLTEAETALRQDDFREVYNCQFQLAQFFESTEDKWLSDHFYRSCLSTSLHVASDEGKTMAEAHCMLGVAQEVNGDVIDAMDNFELFYKLSENHSEWYLFNGQPMHVEACNHLCRIYTSMADRQEGADGEQETQQEIHYLKKAFEMAKEGGNRQLAGEASYKLGVAYERNDIPGTALQYLMSYLDSCRTLEDFAGIGKACEAIAKAFEKEGKIEESIRYLEMFVEVAESNEDEKQMSRACTCLGVTFNTLGRYDAAVEHLTKAYNIARAMNDAEAINSARTLLGVASAHRMLAGVSLHVVTATRPCVERIIEWKDNRGDEFEKPIPEDTAEEEEEPQATEGEDEPQEGSKTDQSGENEASGSAVKVDSQEEANDITATAEEEAVPDNELEQQETVEAPEGGENAED